MAIRLTILPLTDVSVPVGQRIRLLADANRYEQVWGKNQRKKKSESFHRRFRFGLFLIGDRIV